MGKIKRTDVKSLEKTEIAKENLSDFFILLKKNEYIESEKIIGELIKKDPNNFIYNNLLAIVLAGQKRFKESEIILKKIIKKNPKFIDAHINLANIYIDLNQLENSAEYFENAIKINPNYLLSLKNLADINFKQKKYKQSAKLYSKLIEKEPNNLEFLNSYSGNLIKMCDFDNAKKILNKILKINPKHINALINLGVIYREKKDFEKAIQYYNMVLELQPQNYTAYYNLGNIYDENEQTDKAIFYLKKAIKYKFDYAKAYYNLGCVYDKIGKTNDAISCYKKSLNYNPNNKSAVYNLSRSQLATDDYKNGWKGFELRKENDKESYKELGISKKLIWGGDKFKNSLIVHAEQGIGDEVLFSSIFSDLVNYHEDLTISADDRIISIFERSFNKIKFVSRYKKFNYKNNSKHILAGSLGKYFRNTLNEFKTNNKFWLIPNEKKIEKYKNYFYETKKIKVGLSWTTTGINDKKRIIPLIDLAELFPENKFELINLQYGNIKKEKDYLEEKRNRKIIFFSDLDYTNDLESLASLICNCDLIVSIGSFTASFAGALGKEVWTLVPAISTWCWHSNTSRAESLWFPNVKLFKQKNIHDWKYIFNLLNTELSLRY